MGRQSKQPSKRQGFKELRHQIINATEKSISNRHRFIVFLCKDELDKDMLKVAEDIFQIYFQAYTAFRDERSFEGLLLVGRTKFLELVNGTKSFSFAKKRMHFKESESVLGETYGSLVLDLTEGFNPNDLGILVETVKEGGMILALSPPLKEWGKKLSKWHEELISEPYSKEDAVPRFYKRFIKHTKGMRGIIIYDINSSELIKEFLPEESSEQSEIEIPSGGQIKRKLYKLCATQDQIEVLRRFETFFDREREKKMAVITADRGRGKTAILGILTPFLISRMQRVLKRPIRVMLVAQSPQSVQTYFRFLRLALTRQGFSDCKFKESNGMITVVTGRHLRIEYVVPRRAIMEARNSDIVIVDEAAAIDVAMLFKIIEGVRYAIFSSTIHGYEGSGRSFSVRFLKKLEKDESVEIERISLEEPIRYGRGDPIEKWLYRSLLLDSKPASLDESDIESIVSGKLEFEFLNKDKFIENEELLREFFGIYILAHYRNRPSDLVILFDMPNHQALRVSVNGKTVCSLHIAIEGGIGDELVAEMMKGYKPKGQVIPDLIVKHHIDANFPKSLGLRVVRIATHPDVMDRGIGSFALQKLLEWAKQNGYEWVGSGFGVSPELLRFWRRNGFIPLHITPQRNEISGEYTVVVVKALSQELEEKLRIHNSNFIKRLIEYLSDELSDLDVETALMLLESLERDYETVKPEIPSIDRSRMEKYVEGISLYEYVSDIVRPIVRYYFLKKNGTDLSEEEKLVLIKKCLQLKGWWEFGELLREGRVYSILHSAVSKIWKWFGESFESDQL
ncbi:MAG: tRNA(Met) cytidine acetyltransferase [Archaeoglobus sp.]|nr:tRNA(Met) cytidine acetyltransferase [Archaeoglobus sp.]